MRFNLMGGRNRPSAYFKVLLSRLGGTRTRMKWLGLTRGNHWCFLRRTGRGEGRLSHRSATATAAATAGRHASLAAAASATALTTAGATAPALRCATRQHGNFLQGPRDDDG